MAPARDPELIARMRRFFELNEMAEAIMRQNLRRRYPDATPAEIEKHVLAWLSDRPGAPIADAGGPSFRVRRVFPDPSEK